MQTGGEVLPGSEGEDRGGGHLGVCVWPEIPPDLESRNGVREEAVLKTALW